MWFIAVMRSWFFTIITPVFSDPSEIILICWFAAQLLIMINRNLILFKIHVKV